MKIQRTILLAALALAACSGNQEQKVMVRAVPERADDFVWENNLMCWRAYGEGLEDPTYPGHVISSGFDLWVKYPGRLVADSLYYNELNGGRSYHTNYGLGKDCYKVAHTVGAGSSVLIIDGEGRYPSTNYRSFEILEQTPVEACFVLHYPEWEAAGRTISLDRKITVCADSYFCKAEDTYTFSGEGPLKVLAGIRSADYMKKAPKEGWPALEGAGIYATWTAATDQSVEPEQSRIGIAVLVPGSDALPEPADGGVIKGIAQEINSGEPFCYRFGACWSEGNIKSSEEFFELVKNFSAK